MTLKRWLTPEKKWNPLFSEKAHSDPRKFYLRNGVIESVAGERIDTCIGRDDAQEFSRMPGVEVEAEAWLDDRAFPTSTGQSSSRARNYENRLSAKALRAHLNTPVSWALIQPMWSVAHANPVLPAVSGLTRPIFPMWRDVLRTSCSARSSRLLPNTYQIIAAGSETSTRRTGRLFSRQHRLALRSVSKTLCEDMERIPPL